MKSIRKEINNLIIISIIMLSFFMIFTNLVVTRQYSSYNSRTMLNKSCSSQANELNNQFELVKQSVQNIYDISELIRPSIADLNSREKIDEFIDNFQEIAITIADNTDGAISVYYRINPDLTLDGNVGFFWVKSTESGVFEESEITDLLEYDPNDMEHVGWYYVPVWAGEPVWMEPYYNANIGVEMISYVMPIYDGRTLIGVVGMDVDFTRILDIAEDIDIYESSGAVLYSMANSQVYYNRCDMFGKSISNELYHSLQNSEESNGLIDYKKDGERYKLSFLTLENRMKFIVYAKNIEINRQAYISILISAIVFLVSFVLTLCVAMRISRKIIGPVESITEAAKSYAKGNWDVKVECNNEDELKVLTDNIMIMAENTKEYIEYINNMAKIDALTSLNNKTAYMQKIEELNNHDKDYKYAVVVFDVNNLKYINDNYGHEKGDELIKYAANYIKESFPNSDVFRIGGDEFVAVIDGDDFEKRMDIIDEFQSYMKMEKDKDNVNDICIASGIADYPKNGKNYDDVFATADKLMYENKILLKNGVKPR